MKTKLRMKGKSLITKAIRTFNGKDFFKIFETRKVGYPPIDAKNFLFRKILNCRI